MNEIFNKYLNKIKNPKFLIILGVAGILLIFLSSFSTEKTKETVKNESEISISQYRTQLEEDIGEIVKGITNSKKVTVVITLESSMRYKYADITEGASTDKTESNTTISTSSELKQGYITVKTADGGEQALIITTQMPEVRGVAIVCEGGDNTYISEKIQNAVTAALNITSKRVYIAGGNSNEKR